MALHSDNCDACKLADEIIAQRYASFSDKAASHGKVGDLVADQATRIIMDHLDDSEATSRMVAGMMKWSKRVQDATFDDAVRYLAHNELLAGQQQVPQPSAN